MGYILVSIQFIWKYGLQSFSSCTILSCKIISLFRPEYTTYSLPNEKKNDLLTTPDKKISIQFI